MKEDKAKWEEENSALMERNAKFIDRVGAILIDFCLMTVYPCIDRQKLYLVGLRTTIDTR